MSSNSRGKNLCDELGLVRLDILLIEDDEVDAILLEDMLEHQRFGHTLFERASGYLDGLHKLTTHAYHICLLDYQLGLRNGMDLMKRARMDGCKTPFLVLTGSESYDLDLQMMHAGAAGYLEKEDLSPKGLERSMRYTIRNHRVHQHLESLAHQDELTGLYNARAIRMRLSEAAARSKRQKQWMAVILLDLDKFKPINDTHGHDVGDQVLKELARDFGGLVRRSDTVGRLGGDEFVVVLEMLDSLHIPMQVCERIIERVQTPITLPSGIEVTLGVSLGVAMFPRDAEESDALLQCADRAMYIAKKSGGNTFRFWDERATLSLSSLPSPPPK